MKIAICIPAYGAVSPKFMQSLVNMVCRLHTAAMFDEQGQRVTPEIEVITVSTSFLTQSRHKLVAEALYWGADFLLWLDADHIFPPDTFERLWRHGLPVVGCNYSRRCIPTAPTATIMDDNGKKVLLYTTEDKAKAGEIEEVCHLGFGVCLIDMRILDILQARAEEKGESGFLPLFHFEQDGSSVIGEDVFFFNKIRDAGIKVFVDHGLSWEVGHIHEMVMTNAHAVTQRDAWDKKNRDDRERIERKAVELEAGA